MLLQMIKKSSHFQSCCLISYKEDSIFHGCAILLFPYDFMSFFKAPQFSIKVLDFQSLGIYILISERNDSNAISNHQTIESKSFFPALISKQKVLIMDQNGTMMTLIHH